MSEEGWIIRVEALRLARNAVKLNIRDRGERLKDYSMCEITKLAESWRDCHPELFEQATATLLHYRAKLENICTEIAPLKVQRDRPCINHRQKWRHDMATIGYARCSTEGQSVEGQITA